MMRFVALLFSAVVMFVVTAPGRSASSATSASSQGAAFALQLTDGVLTFCDRRGAKQWNLESGRISPAPGSCGAETEPNTACSGLSLDVDVRSPVGGANDIVDAGAESVPLKGRVHDCAAEGKMLAVATGSQVVVIDTETGKSRVVAANGADRVAIGSGWIVWSGGQNLHAARR